MLLVRSDGYLPAPVSLLGILAPYCIALLCGSVVREWQSLLVRQRLADREIAYRREQLRMMHTLHDSVANTLSYAVLLCRSGQGGHDERVERLVEQALKALRSDVIVPVASRIDDDGRTMGASSQTSLSDTGHGDDRSCMDDVRAALHEVDERLDALGFTGEAILINRGGVPDRAMDVKRGGNTRKRFPRVSDCMICRLSFAMPEALLNGAWKVANGPSRWNCRGPKSDHSYDSCRRGIVAPFLSLRYECFVIAPTVVQNAPKLEVPCHRRHRNSAGGFELLDDFSCHIRIAEIRSHVLSIHDAVQ